MQHFLTYIHCWLQDGTNVLHISIPSTGKTDLPDKLVLPRTALLLSIALLLFSWLLLCRDSKIDEQGFHEDVVSYDIVFSSLVQQNMHHMAYSCSFSLDLKADFDLLWWERNYCYRRTNLWLGMCVFILPEKWSSSYPSADISLLGILLITHVFSDSCFCHILPILTWQAILVILWLQKWVRNKPSSF